MTYIDQSNRQRRVRSARSVYLSPEEQDDVYAKRRAKSRSFLDPFNILELGIRWLLKLVEIGAYAFFDKVFVPRLERLREMYERWRNK
jgi:hypothetical protein